MDNYLRILDLPLNELGALDVVESIRRGRFSARDVIQACISRIDAREHVICAWSEVDREVCDTALTPDPRTPLQGVPFGVKDTINTEQLHTEMGSALYQRHRARYDAMGREKLKAYVSEEDSFYRELWQTKPWQ